jgi:hypothetical protein
VFEASGTHVRADDDPAHADIWIVDAAAVDLDRVKAWRADHPQGRLVLFGRSSPRTAAAWQALRPLMIERPDDFEAVRTTLGRAMATEQ